MRTSGLFPSNLDPIVFALGLRGESHINRRPPSFVISPSSIDGSSNQRRRSERRLGTAQRGCRRVGSLIGFRFSVFAISIPRLRTHAGVVASSRLVRRDLHSVASSCFFLLLGLSCFLLCPVSASSFGRRPQESIFALSLEGCIRPRLGSVPQLLSRHFSAAVVSQPVFPKEYARASVTHFIPVACPPVLQVFAEGTKIRQPVCFILVIRRIIPSIFAGVASDALCQRPTKHWG